VDVINISVLSVLYVMNQCLYFYFYLNSSCTRCDLNICLAHKIVKLQTVALGFPSMPVSTQQRTGEVSCRAGEELHPGAAVATAMSTGDDEGPLAFSKIPECWADTGELQQVYQNPLLSVCCSSISS